MSSADAAGTSAPLRKFRFAAGGEGNPDEGGARRFVKLAQKAEELGFDSFMIPDHLGNQVGPIAALGALAVATDKIRIGTAVLANNFRHPAVLAKDATTIDQISGGRLELGIGAGWLKEEYDKSGIAYESPAVRIEKLDESLTILDTLLRGQECNFQGKHYSVNGLQGSPRPRQGPRPPIAVGGGGPKLLTMAAKHADIISLVPSTTAEGKLKLSEITLEKSIERVETIRAAAGDRFDSIELNWTITTILISDDREQTAEMVIGALDNGFPPNMEADTRLSVEQILQSPYIAIGSFEEIAEQIRQVRAATTMSYVGVFPTQMDAFAPVVQLLAGE
ncbi:F420-dependent oxidoreductase [Rhodococcus sp. Leaf7]|uniref:LLM class F420-dependent oxidoreductase n=1 Tax=unclassified Rhodococcus (in: high G+C Gram-positive bacteria) TaxID=192944 RepID=UPI0005AC6324|nr:MULTISPECIES: LLM class F420-dependent oxidoreductase [unclassified Rhodococcus (in: high G+C Gram-positive bacteria)]KIQ16695.1 F420-dependent oxidoreductase [Rhodococcus sp. MEB064]KQU07982.1 F420-dependent oxidoreductase [Rhodococcus sp. Leaf7]KQU43498.1 F420-dependent oxidoreductase [Rhodococcus sp. Leaf247]